MHYIVDEDCERVLKNINYSDLDDKKVVITGATGFIGYNIINLLSKTNAKVIGLDNFIIGKPNWIKDMEKYKNINIMNFDVKEKIDIYKDADYIIHAASIASPIFYRRYPIETMESNILGLWNILESIDSNIKSMLFFSSSEIYGNPDIHNIPTKEDYNGNVSCNGPRSCYDESKRFGEALCMGYFRKKNIPIKIVRPFNNYGPGLNINDRRVMADFCRDVLNKRDIRILSDGNSTRTYCYISDAITGYMKVLLSLYNGEIFNIGNDKPELSINELANIFIKYNKNSSIIYGESKDKDYNINSPRRRCPNIDKSKKLLGYNPVISIDDGICNSIKWYEDNL